MALPTLLRKLFKNDGYGPEIEDGRLSTDITVKDWDASHDYPANVLAKAGGGIYRSVAASGPGVAAGAQNPTADDGTYWTAMPTDDADVMHRSGDELASGVKTFESNPFISNTNPILHLKDTNLETSVSGGAGIDFANKNSVIQADIRFGASASFNNVDLRVYKPGSTADLTSVSCRFYSDNTQYFLPDYLGNDNMNLGSGGHRWKQVFATTSTISTSDARKKTVPEAIPADVLDAWGAVDFVQFKMLDAVERKGADKARLHSGLIAQRIDEAFKARGLDASMYGLFCHDEWVDEPESGVEAGDQYSLRYEEALCMEAACQRRRADRAEARIAALEERLAAIEAKLG